MSVSLVEQVSALITVDGGVCVSGGTCQYTDHRGWVYQTLTLTLTTVNGCVFVSGAKCQSCDHCGCVYRFLWSNMSLL